MKVCPNCFTENNINIDFCKKCGCPIGDLVNYDPVKRILSTGWMYRKAVSSPSSSIIFYGMFLLFGIPLVLIVFSLMNFFKTVEPLFIIFCSVVIVVYSILLYRVTINYYKNKKEALKEN